MNAPGTHNAPARIAVVIPCHDDGPLVEAAVASVTEREAVEIAVVDDASTDPATLEALDRLAAEGVIVIHHAENRGNGPARMTGMSATSARYVFPLDADDLAVAGSLAAMADRLDSSPGASVCFGDYLEFGGPREIVRAVPHTLDPYRLAFANEYPISSMFRRTALDAVNGWEAKGYDSSLYSDWNLWMTLAEAGAVGVHLGGALSYRRRLHGGRLNAAARRRHRTLYANLRRLHPALFSDLRRHRSRSGLGPVRRRLYPFVYGGRPKFQAERWLKPALDRLGVWTLQRR